MASTQFCWLAIHALEVGALSSLVLVLALALESGDTAEAEVLVIASVLAGEGELAMEDAAVLEMAEVLLTPVGT